MDLTKTGENRPPPKMKLFQDPPTASAMQRRASISGDSSSRPLSSISENIQQSKRTIQRSQSFVQPTKGMGISPTKKRNPGPLLPYTSVWQGQLDTIRMPPPEIKRGGYNGSPQKKPSFSRFDTSIPNIKQSEKTETLMPKYNNAKAAFQPIDKENFPPNIPSVPNKSSSKQHLGRASSTGLQEVENKLLNALSNKDMNQISNPPRTNPPQDKPPLQEAAPIKENAPQKIEVPDHSSVDEIQIPQPQEMPTIVDDGEKPSYSYATLIGMAILRAPNRRLTLAQIYKWISDTFAYYRTSDHGWQNSIRHNLSLNKALIRQERPKDEPGKGSYWTIKEGQEYQFITGKGGNKRALAGKKGADKPTKKSKESKAVREEAHKEEKKHEIPSTPLPQVPNTDSTVLLDDPHPQISSDATRTATPSPRNTYSIENNFPSIYNGGLMAAPPLPHSSPSQDFRSSPPIARPISSNASQTTPRPYFQSSSIRKRKYRSLSNSMHDSGYLSSFDSSVLRGGDDDRRIKRGRAEEDIARIRRRSTISASPLTKLTMAQKGSYQTSSPFYHYDATPLLGNLTPATTLRPTRQQQQQQAPLSASPGTNLKIFRNSIHEMVGSPATNVETLSEESLDVLFETFIDRSPYSASGSKDTDPPKSPPKSPCPPSRMSFGGFPYKRSAPRRFPPVDSNFLSIPSESNFLGTTVEDDFDEDAMTNSLLFTNAL